MEKRYFRRAKGDTCFPHDAKGALLCGIGFGVFVVKNIFQSMNQYSNWILIALLVAVFFLYLKQDNKRNIEPSSDVHFQSVVAQESRPVLVKFGATWCGPCVSTDRALAEYDSSSTGEVKIVILDVDANPEIARHYGVSTIPHSFLFLGGKVIDDRIGGMDVPEIRSWVKSNEKHWKR